MKLLHTSDWHIGKSINAISLLEDQSYYLDQLKTLIKEQAVDVLLISGDLYDRSVPPAEAVKLVDTFISDLVVTEQVKVLCIAGNHDSGERLSFASRLYEASGFYMCGKPTCPVQKVTLQDAYGDVHFYLLPYLEPGKMKELYPDREIKTFDDAYAVVFEEIEQTLDPNARNVLLAHGFFSFIGQEKEDEHIFSASEISVGGSDLVSAARFEPFDYVALGHLHAPQHIGKPYIRYSGSLLKYSVDEAGQYKSLPLVTLGEKGEMQTEFITIRPLHDVRIITGNFEQLLNESEPSEDYVFAKLTDQEPIPDAAAKLRTTYKNILGVRYAERVLSEERLLTPDAIEQKTPETLFEDFFAFVTGESLDDAQKAAADAVFKTMDRGSL